MKLSLFSKIPFVLYEIHWLILPDLQGSEKDFFMKKMSPQKLAHFLLVMSTMKSVI